MKNDKSGAECTFIIVPSRKVFFDSGKAGADKTLKQHDLIQHSAHLTS